MQYILWLLNYTINCNQNWCQYLYSKTTLVWLDSSLSVTILDCLLTYATGDIWGLGLFLCHHQVLIVIISMLLVFSFQFVPVTKFILFIYSTCLVNYNMNYSSSVVWSVISWGLWFRILFVLFYIYLIMYKRAQCPHLRDHAAYIPQ